MISRLLCAMYYHTWCQHLSSTIKTIREDIHMGQPTIHGMYQNIPPLSQLNFVMK